MPRIRRSSRWRVATVGPLVLLAALSLLFLAEFEYLRRAQPGEAGSPAGSDHLPVGAVGTTVSHRPHRGRDAVYQQPPGGPERAKRRPGGHRDSGTGPEDNGISPSHGRPGPVLELQIDRSSSLAPQPPADQPESEDEEEETDDREDPAEDDGTDRDYEDADVSLNGFADEDDGLVATLPDVNADFASRASALLGSIMKGIDMHSSFARLVLNQQAMAMPQKAKRRARVGTDEDLLGLLPEEDLQVQYPRCALVGNSGILLQQHVGLLIDKYDAVLRLNNAPTQGFEQYVGTRTTFRAINNHWTKGFSKALSRDGRKAALQLLPADSKRATSLLCFGQGAFKMYVALKRSLPKDRRVYYIAPEVTTYAKQAFKAIRGRMEKLSFGPYRGGRTMPSGFEGLLFMMHVCGELHVYGFDPQTDKNIKYHYFDDVQPWEGVHSFDFSFDYLKLLHVAGHIKLCAPGYNDGDTGCPKEEHKVNEFSALWGQD